MISASSLIESLASLTDDDVVRRVLQGETALYEVLMRRYNHRLYRVARAILPTKTETEDAMQDAFVRAYGALAQYEGRASFSTWIISILVHECYARMRKFHREPALEDLSAGDMAAELARGEKANPEETAAAEQLRRILEQAISGLPSAYRAAFILREVEGLSVKDAAICAGISEENLRTRDRRARVLLRNQLKDVFTDIAQRAYPFAGEDCDRMVTRVFGNLSRAKLESSSH